MVTARFPYTQLPDIHDARGLLIATCHYYPDAQLLHLEWNGNLTSSEVIAVAKSFLALQPLLPVPRLLNDKTNSTGDWSEAMSWLEYEWLPQATKGGLQAVAYVFSPELDNQYVSFQFIEKVRQHIPIEHFYKKEEAFAWLRGVEC